MFLWLLEKWPSDGCTFAHICPRLVCRLWCISRKCLDCLPSMALYVASMYTRMALHIDHRCYITYPMISSRMHWKNKNNKNRYKWKNHLQVIWNGSMHMRTHSSRGKYWNDDKKNISVVAIDIILNGKKLIRLQYFQRHSLFIQCFTNHQNVRAFIASHTRI